MTVLYYVLWIGLSLWAVVRLLIDKREPSSTLAWLFFIILAPIVGPAIFLIFGPQRLERRAVRRKAQLHEPFSKSARNFVSSVSAGWLSPETFEVLRLAKQVSEFELTAGNSVEILPDPAQTLHAMQNAIDEAEQFIHLEYYIIASDEVTEQLFDHLAQAAQRGVQVRILYDSLGSLSLKRIYFKRLVDRGVKVAGFLPFTLIPRRLNFNFRNHRKILIVDGKIAFTGGTNIGRDYLGRAGETQWRDYSVRVQGPVCAQLEDVFAKDWEFTTNENLFDPRYYPTPEAAGDSVIQVLESGPDTPFRVLHQALFLAITNARTQILMTTAYFVPDSSMMTALTVAALRGVDVQLLLPAKTDSWVVQSASRSFYSTLLKAGARIYEYQPRKLHAKMLVVDDRWTILGSSNMDIRSFRLNFELNLMVHGETPLREATSFFEKDRGQSLEIKLEDFEKRPLPQQILENACRLFSPIL